MHWFWRLAFSALLLGGVCWLIGPREIGAVAAATRPQALIPCMAWFLAHTALGILNLWVLVSALAPGLRLGGVLRAALRAWVLGMFTPGRLGELGFGRFLDPDHASLGVGLAVVVVDKLGTLAVSLLVGCLALLVYVGARSAATAAGLGGIILAAVVVGLASGRLRAFVRRRVLGRYEARFVGFSTSLGCLLRQHRPRLVVNLALTAVRILVQGFVLQAAFAAFGEAVGLVEAAALTTIAQVAGWVPISLAGIGVTEGSAVALFGSLGGIAPPPVLSAFLLVRLFAYVVGAVCLPFTWTAPPAPSSVEGRV